MTFSRLRWWALPSLILGLFLLHAYSQEEIKKLLWAG
jgi:hypothetical protein